MEEQLYDIFNFIREKGGAAKLKQLQRRFNASPDLEQVLEAYNSLFFISKIKENNWMVQAKVDVELCVSYLRGSCDGSCESLHICKSFLLSGEQFCKQPCKNGFSHNINDSHNEAVLYRYNLGHYDIGLLRSSFPRLCNSFQESGKCDKFFCGYLHLCRFFVQGKCQKECQFATRVGLSKQDVHGLTLTHNLRVFSSFDLRERKHEVLIANVLFHSEQSEISSGRSINEFEDPSNVKSRGHKYKVRMCCSYLHGACSEGSNCPRLHFCKEYLIGSNDCPNDKCKYGFSHDPFDKNNYKITKSNWKSVEDKTRILSSIRECFPHICIPYEANFCEDRNCKKLHICRYFLFDACEYKTCKLSHNFIDGHNLTVFEHFNMRGLITKEKEVVVSNILVSKMYKRSKMTEGRMIGTKSNDNVKTLTTTNSIYQASCSNEFVTRKFSGTAGSRPPLIMCSFYLNGKCDKGNDCKRLHLCKEFLIHFERCPGIICQFGFSHNPFDENNSKITKSVWTETDSSTVISFLRESFRRLCEKYEKGDCNDENCQKLHICADFLFLVCNSNYCCFSHNITDEHNLSVFQKYNLYGVSKMPMAYILPNILTTKRLGNLVDTGRVAYTDLSKSSQSVSRKSLNKCSSPLLEVESINKFPHIVRNESAAFDLAVSEIFSNEQSNSIERLTKYQLNKRRSKEVSTYNALPESFAFSWPEISASNYPLASEPIILKGTSDLGYSTTKTFDLNVISKSIERAKKTIFEPTVEDVSSYILRNFDEGYCMANDVGFQLLFPEKLEEEILEWCKIQKRYFRLKSCGNSNMRIYPCFDDVEPCSSYWKKARCKNKKCGKFHICKRLMLGEMHNRNSCTQNHSFENETLKSLIKDNKLESFTDKQILVLLRNRFPFVCPNYQTNDCAEGEKKCSMLHICQHFVTKQCAKAVDICELNHEAALESKQAKRISEEFHISQTRLLAVLLLKGTNQKIGATNFKDGRLDWQKESALCIDFLNDECAWNMRCKLKHNPYKTPYLWEYKESSETSWTNYDKKSNENIERSFCNPSQTRSNHADDPRLEVWFQQVPTVHETHYTNGSGMLYRRLSTSSSVTDDNSTKLGKTKWKWYWQESEGVWEEYKTGTISKEIEKSFLKANQCDHVFTMNGFVYTLSFNEMCQRNIDKRCSTERNVRRRPEFQCAKDSKLNEHSTTYPSHWPSSITEGSTIDVSSKVYGDLKEKFQASIKTSVRIGSIKEICNHDYYDRYESKKRKMEKKHSANEKLLYHGTSYDVADAICHQNFDSRLCGKNATLYGKGAYFSKSASYSHSYSTADSKGHYYMFVAQVLVGRYAAGDPSYARPPPLKLGSYKLYDSCVDEESNPTMFIVFERDQCYPKYLIEYELRKSAMHSSSYLFSSPNFSPTSSPLWSSASPNINSPSSRYSTTSQSTSQ